MQVEFIHENPKHPIHIRLKNDLANAERVFIASGFLSHSGINFIIDGLQGDVSKIRAIVVGAATRKAFDTFDILLQQGMPVDRLRLHLGYAKREKLPKMSSGYRPMFHSKIILIERTDRELLAYVGSHNVTGFAMGGINGEACIRIRGKQNNQLLLDIFQHIKSAFHEAVIYSKEMKKPFLWWINRHYKGLLGFISSEDFSSAIKAPSLIILAARTTGVVRLKDVIYMSVPRNTFKFLKKITAAHIHLYLFPPETLPSIENIHHPNVLLFACELAGAEVDHGAKSVEASWEITDPDAPKLYSVPDGTVKADKEKFNKTAGALSQIRIRPTRLIEEKFEYLVQEEASYYDPKLDENKKIEETNDLQLLSEKEKGFWVLVNGLEKQNRGSNMSLRAQTTESLNTPFLIEANEYYKLS